MFQVRSDETGIREYKTFAEALEAANADSSAWKISFPVATGERIRLIFSWEDNRWYLEQMPKFEKD